MQQPKARSKASRKRKGALRGAAAAFAVVLAIGGVGTSLAIADDDAASSDAEASQPREFTLDELLTPLGGDKPEAVSGDGIAPEAAANSEEGDIATIVVQLEEKPASAIPNPFAMFFGVNDDQARHDDIRAKIQSLVDGEVASGGLQLQSVDGEEPATQIEVVADYYHAIDGFAIKAPKGIVDDIQGIDGVKRAYVDEVYTLPPDQGEQENREDPAPKTGLSLNAVDDSSSLVASDIKSADLAEGAADADPANKDALDMTGANKVDYRGEGQVIAIIDSGLQTNHEAFTGDLNDETVAFTESQIAAAKSGLESGAANAKYVSEKIIFCYDYADNDDEVTPGTSTDLSHGTHVAGIAAANGGQIEGAAPDAQIMMLKVCDDFQGAIRNSDLLRAMDDLVSLDEAAEKNGGHGIDSMNMSIGSDNGFSDRASDAFGDAVQALEDAGITSNIAAGNSYSAGRGNKSGKNLPYATDPDEGLVSSPAVHDGAVAVASVNSSEGKPCFYFGEDYVEYQQLSTQDGSATAQFSNLDDGVYSLVDGGIGSTADAKAVSDANGESLAGKMVLIVRGGEEDGTALTFQKKAENFQSMNPVAVIIYDNVNEATTNFGLSSGLDVPVVGISLESGSKMIEQLNETGSAQVRTKAGDISPSSGFGSYTMSDFSSWGSAPEMEIKPEITAPGGNIYSAVTGGSNAYGYMSGTSMATPQMAGISAQVAQYVATDSKFAGMSAQQKHDLVTELLMSTARPMDEPGDAASYYPVREQGAGLADVAAATSTPVYLTVDGARVANRPKANIGENEDGTWSFDVTLHNLTGDDVSYTPEAHAISDQVADGLLLQDTKDWTGEGIAVSYGGAAYDAASNTVTVPANGTATYTVNITCEDSFKTWASDNTPNGAFVEGFALLKKKSDNAVDLSTPFLGFYGDWDAVPAFDDELTGKNVHLLGSYAANGNSGTPLGVNPLDTMAQYAESYASYVHDDKIVVSNTTWSSSPSSLIPFTGLMRNVKNYTYDYKNAAGVSVRNYSKDYVSKAYYNSNYGLVYPEQFMSGSYPAFDGKGEDGRTLPDGKYVLSRQVTTAGADNSTQSAKDLEFFYDTTKPRVTDVTYTGEGKDRTVSFKVTDNSWLSAVSFNDPSTGGYILRKLADDENGDGSARVDEKETFVENEDGTRTWEFTFKVQDIVDTWDSYDTGETIPNTVNLYCYDYGLSANDAVKIVIKPVPPTGLSISPEEMTLYAGQEGVFEALVEPADATETDMTWTSSDEEIATVSNTGVVHANKNGEVTITATMDADPSIKATAKLSITDVPEDVGIAMMTDEITVPYGAVSQVNAILAPAYAGDAVTWTSSDEQIATVEGDSAQGTVTAGERTGNAVITASVTHDGATYEASMTVKVRVDDYGDFVIDEDYEEGPRLLYYAGYRNEVTIPDNVVVIGPEALAGCSPTEVTVPASVKKIEDSAFYYMPNLKTVHFEDTAEHPSQLTQIGDQVFYYDLMLEEVVFPSNLKKMGTNTFVSSTVKKVVLPESLRTIPDGTFYYCSVSDVTISDRVTHVGKNAFSANSVSEIKLLGAPGYKEGDPLPTGLPSSLVSVGDYAFSGYGASEIILPDGLKTIGNGGFSSTAARKVVLNDGLEYIGDMGFGGCNATEIVIPDSVTHVGKQAFYSMPNCKTFTIGRKIAKDDLDEAFVADYACVEFVVPDDCENYSAIDGILFNKDATKLVSITEGSQPSNGEYTVPDGTVDIAAYGFYDTKLATVDFPASLKTIGTSCFTSANLTSVVLPEGFETIYNGAFQNCDKIRSVDLGGTKTVKRYAFYANASLSDLNMRSDLNRLEVIEEGGFTECASIKEFVFPDSLKAINGMGMINMPALQKVHIGAGMTGSLAGAFTGDPNLSEITVSEDNPVYHADQNVLYGIMSEEVDPEYPGKHLFLSLPTNTFSEYVVEEGTVVIDAQAFRNNTSLRKVTLPEGLKKLCTGSFNSCTNLSEINFPDSLEYVTGLYSTSSLKNVDFGTKIKEIEDNAFMGDLPAHIVVRGGQNGKFIDGMDFTGDKEGADTAYFGPGMTSITFSWTAAPNITVIPADATEVNLHSPKAEDIANFYVYVPAGSEGEEAVKAALSRSHISESHIRDYKELGGTLAMGTPTGDDDGGSDVEVKSYSIGATWYKTGTDEESSVSTYLGNTVFGSYAGEGKYRITFAPNSVFANMIADMMFDGKSMDKDGSNYSFVLNEEQLKGGRLNIGFKISTSGMTMSQDADVQFDAAAVQDMIDDVAARNTGTNANKMELFAQSDEEPTVTAGGIIRTGEEADVYVKSYGGVVGQREYRFVETSPSGSVLVLQNWSTERAFKWQPVTSGATLTAEVRDATKLSVKTAGILRTQNERGQAAAEALDELIESMSSIDASKRADDANAQLQEAIAAAKGVAQNNNATPKELQDALAALQEAASTYGEAPQVTPVVGTWYKEGTYGTDSEEASMIGARGMVLGNVRVSKLEDGAYALDLDLSEQAAGMMTNVAYGEGDAIKLDDDTYRVIVTQADLAKPLSVSFTYTAGPMGEMTHAADLVLDADGLAIAMASVTDVPVSWYQSGTDKSSQTAGFIEPNAQVRYVDGKYLVDITTNSPEWLTNMRIGDVEAESVGAGTFRFEMTEEQLGERLAIEQFVVPMGNKWTASDAAFDPEAVAAAVATAAADEVARAIDALPDEGSVADADAALVKAAQQAFGALSDAARGLVPSRAVEKLDKVGAALASELMSGLDANSSEEEIKAAREAFEALSPAATNMVGAGAYQNLLVTEAAQGAKSDSGASGAGASGPAAKKVVTSITVNVKTVNAKTIAATVAKAGGNIQDVTTVTLGKKVKKIAKGAFKGTKVTTIVAKTKKLKKKSVKGSLKGSKVKTVKVQIGKKKVNKKYVKKYKKIFTKKNAGKKAKVTK